MSVKIELVASYLLFISSLLVVKAKPNILIIFADDVGTGGIPGYDKFEGLGGTGMVDMPNLREFVNKGTLFTDFHSTPLCAPSRYSFLSGNYQHRGTEASGMWDLNYLGGNQFLPHQKSIADMLRDESNYHTAMMGKWHIGGKIPTINSNVTFPQYPRKSTLLSDANHDWSKPIEQGPQNIGFDSSFITTGGLQSPPYKWVRDGYFEDPSEYISWKKGSTNYMPGGKSKIIVGGEGSSNWDSTQYNIELVKETERFLDDHQDRRKDDPFFAYVALGSAHIPHSPPRKYLDGSPVYQTYPTRHMDILFEMDKVVGSLVALLEEREVLNNTLVVFLSDNGGLGSSKWHGHNENGLLRGGKGQIWEGGHRVPLIMRWDGVIPEGESRSHLIGINDLYATLCEVAGVPIYDGQGIDSVSFANYMKSDNNTAGLREYLGVWRYKEKKLRYESIRKGPFKYVIDQQEQIEFLFNLEEDIEEHHNLLAPKQQLFGINEYQELVKQMAAELEKMKNPYSPTPSVAPSQSPTESCVASSNPSYVIFQFENVCVDVSTFIESNTLTTLPCDNSDYQKFVADDYGQLRLKIDDKLCLEKVNSTMRISTCQTNPTDSFIFSPSCECLDKFPGFHIE
mmetsp:Transcript_10454/g.14774  ORF Transcript_10454/g.14774 Transcript_10454/m.14774 type:complete len:624 (+) Transcript_10454:91-1962(+)